MRGGRLNELMPGVALTVLVALVSFMVSFLHSSFDSLTISIILGVVVSSMVGDRKALEAGIEASLRFFLPLGIMLYGSNLVLRAHDLNVVSAAIVVMAFFFIVTYFVCKSFGLSRTLSALMGTGMSVCGASAIVVISPFLGAKKEDTSVAVLSVITVGLTGMLFYRFVPDVLHVSSEKFALITGLTLPMVGQVKVAASVMGADAVAAAMNYKLVRIAALLVFTAAAFIARRIRGDRGGVFPWFLLGFYAMAAFVNFTSAGARMRMVLEPASGFMLAAALAAVGLSVDVESVVEKGPAPVLAVFLSAGISGLTVALFLGLMR